MESYKKVTNFNELLDLNVDFIEGKINWTPYHQQPLQNVGHLKQDLIKVNQNGFLTLGGQCPLETPQREQKLFLDGYLDTNLVRDFIKYLKGFKKFEFFIEFPNKQIKTNIRNWKVLNVGQGGYYNSLRRVKETPTDSSSNWKDDFILPFRDLSYITLTGWKGFDNILEILKNYAFVHLQHRSFHNKHNDIYPLINGFLKSKKSKFGENRYQKFKSFVLKKKRLISLISICITLLTAGYFINKKLLKQAQDVVDTGTPQQVTIVTQALQQQVENVQRRNKGKGPAITESSEEYLERLADCVMNKPKEIYLKSDKPRVKTDVKRFIQRKLNRIQQLNNKPTITPNEAGELLELEQYIKENNCNANEYINEYVNQRQVQPEYYEEKNGFGKDFRKKKKNNLKRLKTDLKILNQGNL